MEPVKVLRQGKGTFCEWRFENGQSRGRILNQGAGVLLDTLFSSAEEAKTFCEGKLKQDASAIFYVVQGEAIIDAIHDDAYHQA